MADPDVTYVRYSRDGHTREFGSFVPPLYLIGIGAVLTEWALFEQFFDAFLDILRWNPVAVAIEPRLPNAFRRRAKLIKQSVVACFPNCPTVQGRVTDIADRAIFLGTKRNDVSHSHWFSTGEMIIWTTIDGSGPRYKLTTDDLFHLASLIRAVHNDLTLLTTSYLPGTEDASIPLQERHALRDHYTNNRPTNPIGGSVLAPPLPFLP